MSSEYQDGRVCRKQHCKDDTYDDLFAYYNLKVYIEQMRTGHDDDGSLDLLATLLLIAILTPFFLFEESMNAWVERLTGPRAQLGMVTVAVVSFSRWMSFAGPIERCQHCRRSGARVPARASRIHRGDDARIDSWLRVR